MPARECVSASRRWHQRVGVGPHENVRMLTAFLNMMAITLAAWAAVAAASQVSFEQATRDLGSSDPGARMRAVQLLKGAAYPQAAVPLAKLVTDPEEEIQLEAIAAE